MAFRNGSIAPANPALRGGNRISLTVPRGAHNVDEIDGRAVPLLLVKEVKKRRRGFTRISAKHQATIPVQALKEAGLKPGDEVRVVAAGRGRLVLERDLNVVERHAGKLRGVYEPGELNRLRDEWR